MNPVQTFRRIDKNLNFDVILALPGVKIPRKYGTQGPWIMHTWK